MRALAAVLLASSLGLACESPGRRDVPQGSGPGPAAAEIPIEEQVRRLATTSRPTPMHERLAPLVGEWVVELAGPELERRGAGSFQGRATIAPVLGGRFLRWDLRIDFGGTPGASLWHLGYDLASARYQLVMMSDVTTSVAVAHGQGDPAADGLVLVWDVDDTRTNRRLQARARLRVLGRDRFVLEQLEARPGGGELPALVWTYTRAGSASPTR